ncbi:hypothetical protein LEMLEM_LOCUS15352 [Lemmus lemmus]
MFRAAGCPKLVGVVLEDGWSHRNLHLEACFRCGKASHIAKNCLSLSCLDLPGLDTGGIDCPILPRQQPAFPAFPVNRCLRSPGWQLTGCFSIHTSCQV